jgi:DNA-binding Lrp family transcriptional regulator
MVPHSTLMSDIMDEMDPRILNLIKKHVFTFTRWDMLRFLYENADTEDTTENLAQRLGRTPDAIRQEAEEMTREGILKAIQAGEYTVYGLTDDPETRQLVASLVETAQERTFRMKLVYHILRAGGRE